MKLVFVLGLLGSLQIAGRVMAINLPGVPSVFLQDKSIMSAIADDIAEKFAKEYIQYWKTGIESPVLKQLTIQLANAHSKKDLFTKDFYELEPRDHFASCTFCRATMHVFIRSIREEGGELHDPESGEELIKNVALDFCLRFDLQTEEVCNGLIQSHFKTFDYITRNSEIDSRSFCGLFMELSFCNDIDNPSYNWTLNINNNRSEITGPKSNSPKPSAQDLTICQLTDIHLDPLYEPGSLAECDEPMCCQRNKSIAEGTSKAAGYWGDYRDCDLPWHSFEEALQHIVSNHNCDVVIQTGDIVDHMVWATSIEKNSEVLTKVINRMSEVFGDVPIYSCIGNHEPHPLNLFSPSEVPNDINTRWLYEHLYNDWSKWLPQSTKDTFLEGGYYTVLTKYGYRIIALNSNDCFSDNWWLYHNGTNKQSQLNWLHDTLLEAEESGEYVHILTHIPPGDGTCWSVWAREYNRIISRFSNTISGIFNGHSHMDELSVHYSKEGYATAVAWNGGALTTYSNKNPNYRVYNIDPATYQVTNHRTYIFNLTEANLTPDQKPVWFEEYDFAQEFTDDLSPNGIDQLFDKFADNPNLLRKFWRFKMTLANPKIDAGCDRDCLLQTLCRAAITVNSDTKRCETLKARLNIALDNEEMEITTSNPNNSTSNPNNTTSTPTNTTAVPVITTPKPGGGGAASLTAMSIGCLWIIVLMRSYIF